MLSWSEFIEHLLHGTAFVAYSMKSRAKRQKLGVEVWERGCLVALALSIVTSQIAREECTCTPTALICGHEEVEPNVMNHRK